MVLLKNQTDHANACTQINSTAVEPVPIKGKNNELSSNTKQALGLEPVPLFEV